MHSENEEYKVLGLSEILHDSCMDSRKPYMTFVRLLRYHTNQTNHIYQSKITK